MNKDRLLELADEIEPLLWSHPVDGIEHDFCMYSCLRENETPSCIAAFAVQLFSDNWRKTLSDERRFGGEMAVIHAEAQSLLGLEEDVAKELFTPSGANAGAWPGYPGYISPFRAADTIRRLANTGAVNWGEDADYEDTD